MDLAGITSYNVFKFGSTFAGYLHLKFASSPTYLGYFLLGPRQAWWAYCENQLPLRLFAGISCSFVAPQGPSRLLGWALYIFLNWNGIFSICIS